MKRFFLGGLVVAPLFFLACATGGATEDDPGGGVEEGDAGDGGTAGSSGKGGKGGAGGKGGKGGTSGSGGIAGKSSEGGQGGTLGGSGTGGGPGGGAGGTSGSGGSSGKGGSAGKGGSTAGSGGKGGSNAGNGGSSAGNGGSAGTTGGAGKGGTSAGNGGTNAGNGGASAGSAGTNAGNGGSGAGTGGSSAGTGGSSAGVGGSAGQGGSSAGAGGSGPVDACATALAKLKVGFEGGAEGTTTEPLDGQSGSSWPFVQWETGTASSSLKPTGPSACKSGARCLANDFDSDYCQCGRSAGRTPIWDLTACAGRKVSLEFDHWYDFSVISFNGNTYYDGGLVELTKAATPNVGGTWVAAPAAYSGTIKILGSRNGFSCLDSNSFHVNNKLGFVGDSGGQWVHEVVPIPNDYLVTKFQARFAWSSGVSWDTNSQSVSRAHSSPGWYIDNIGLSVAP